MIKKQQVFRFSSLEHPGCRVHVLGQPTVSDVEVCIERGVEEIHDITATYEIRSTPVRVHGKLHGWKSKFDPSRSTDDSASVDVRIKAYSPMTNTDYVMAILGVHVVDDTTGEFVACAVRPWYDASNSVKPLTIPLTWHNVPIKLKEGTDVGKIEEWIKTKKGHKIQHVDKLSVPSRTCTNCGKRQMNSVTGTCESCGERASRLAGNGVHLAASLPCSTKPLSTRRVSVTTKPEGSPAHEGETILTKHKVNLVEDGHGPVVVDITAEVYQVMKLPGKEGLELKWVRRGMWLQVPLENMWMLAEGAQIPLTKVTPAKTLGGIIVVPHPEEGSL